LLLYGLMALERVVRAALSGLILVSGASLGSRCLAQGTEQTRQKTTQAPAEQNQELEEAYRKCLLEFEGQKILDPNTFSVLVEKAPNDPRTHMIYGNALSMSIITPDNFRRAIKEYDKAIELNPKVAAFYINRGIARYAINEPTEEIPMWMITNENMPEDFVSGAELAIKDFDTAIRLNPRLFSAYLNKGVILKRLGKDREAVSCFKKAIEIGLKNKKPPFPTVANEDGVEFVGTGHPMMAISNFRRFALDTKASITKKEGTIVLFNPNAVYVSNENDPLALAYYHMGTAYASSVLRDYPPALDCLDRAIKLNPGMPFLYSTKWVIYRGRGDTDKLEEQVLLYKEVAAKINRIREAEE